ncbi:N-acetylmannosamine-6-phosphate 2-epimerase [uncultured Meiothermus sp.]|uniref:N-acetylmannosamine-6-phosphate 2-epimerase n=1 Tax=uncultured Meiothermus sp. TaxID=157471 RepID=UPI0026149CD4|nr:N-acetylmannosamine-6-phosphate 2-epimerase [uncultured Meiothermus sp.]
MQGTGDRGQGSGGLVFPSLIVSCQARGDNPLQGSQFMAAMAQAAEQGGARGIRANGAEDVRAIRAVTTLPIIGIHKHWIEGYEVYITPDFAAAKQVAEAGADVIALDATARPRPRESLAELIGLIQSELGKRVCADISTLKEGLAAAEIGADFVATTLAGYTPYSPKTQGPDFDLIKQLANLVAVPIVAEGRFWSPEEVSRAFELGASAVVIGTAITNPLEITRRFAQGVPT